MPTFRNFAKTPFRCSLYEAQDVLFDVDEVDMICLDAGRRLSSGEVWMRKVAYHDFTKRLMFINPGLRQVRLTREYDLFVAVCQNYFDLLYLNAIDGWKDQCKTSVCWIDELWASRIPAFSYWLHALSRFDHVFVGSLGSVAGLAKAINRPCHWLPGGADSIRFSPYPNPPARAIDVYSIGRRWEGIHQALLSAARRKEIFYVHDTFQGADMETYDYQQHRDLFANMAKRSQYFIVAPAKMNVLDETDGQVEIGYRYYEGAAAGAVMIGQTPRSEAFTRMFQWPEVVIDIAPDGTDVIEVLARLRSQPERLSAISHRNATESLLRHDWLYRWKEMFRVAGIDPLSRMVERESRLHDLASEIALNKTAAENIL